MGEYSGGAGVARASGKGVNDGVVRAVVHGLRVGDDVCALRHCLDVCGMVHPVVKIIVDSVISQ